MKTSEVLEVARLYYEQNKTQDEIAHQLSVSRSTISRALKLARARGYIRTVVVGPSIDSDHLQAWFRNRFDLQHVVIVPGEGNSQELLDSVGQTAATYLDRVIIEDTVLTVPGGRTLLSISKQLRPTHRPGVSIVPVMGGWVNESVISANEVVREMATRWQAKAETLFAPAIVSDTTARRALLREDSIRLTLEKAQSATVACLSVAAIHLALDGVPRPYDSSSGRIPKEDLNQLLNMGAVGETCAQFFDIRGNPIDTWNLEKTIAVSFEQFKQMATVIMAGVGVEKARALLGVCRSGIVTALIISEDLAYRIKELDEEGDTWDGK
jgi:DNA-binding transcriptional regulator LsrR (DeoR family)